MSKPHLHAEYIKSKADGKQIQERMNSTLNWIDMPSDDWYFVDEYEYRIKPEREYPVTSLPRAILSAIYFSIAVKEMTVYADALEEVANAAIKQHIIDTEGK